MTGVGHFTTFDAVKGWMQEPFLSAVVPEAGAAIEVVWKNFTMNASNPTAVGIVALAVTNVLLLYTIEDTLIPADLPPAKSLAMMWNLPDRAGADE